MSSAPLDGTAPTALKLARILVYVSVGLGVVLVLVSFGIAGSGSRRELQGIAGFVVSVGIQAVLTALMTKGRSWPRTVLTVLIVLSLVVAVLHIEDFVRQLSAGTVGPLIALLDIVAYALLAIALLPMWSKRVTQYLTAET